jgi:hypothetical protein
MFDFPMRLDENTQLLSLLSHYAQLGAEDRTVWQDRLMQMDGVDREQLTVLHGELIACDWIEQNTGRAQLRPDGTLSACYRITSLGLREFRRVHGVEVADDQVQATEKPQPRVPRKKKDKAQPQPDAVTSSE